jgi:ABC-2 type transport system permease protein
MTERQGEVYDIGYQRYHGPREGRSRARKGIWINGLRTSLGLGRGWTSKILPALLIIAMVTPALVFTLIASFAGPDSEAVSGHADYFEIAARILLLFSAIIAPELLTTDRRNGVINLYLVRPLSLNDYIIGRWLAFFSITLIIVYLPHVILFLGLSLSAPDVWDYLQNNWLNIPRFIASGLIVAVFTTTIPLAVAAFTTRRAYAAAFVIGLFIVSTATGNALVEEIGGASAKWYALIDITSVPIFINDMIFNKADSSELIGELKRLPAMVVYAWYLVLTVGPASLLWWRYQNLRT